MMRALAFAAALNICVGNPNANRLEATESLKEVANLQIIGDFVTIATKNSIESHSAISDCFDEYLHSHVIRIKVPFLPDRYWNFELGDLIFDDKTEGRKKGKRLREILLPLLLALKYKLTVVLPIFMALVIGLALKGAWAGITGLFISKLVALKVLLQSQKKEHDDHGEDPEDDPENTDHHSVPPLPYGIANESTAEEGQQENSEPIIIHLHSDGHYGKFSRRRVEHSNTRLHVPIHESSYLF